MYAGDFALGATIDLKFTTRRFSTGAPFTLAGSPAVAAYPDNDTTQITAGITLTVDFDSVTGLNNVRVVATSGNGYAAGSSYFLVITAGTVDSVSVVGEVVGSFTLGRVADAIWDEEVDGTVTARQSLRLANSANGAKLSGAATASVAIRDLADTKDRVTATVDSDGNRTAVTRDLT
jgi:hypothetical protein